MLVKLYRSKEGQRFSLVAVAVLLIVGAWALTPEPKRAPVLLPKDAAVPAMPNLGTLPLSFEPNMGQADQLARYVAHAPGGVLFFTPSGVALALQMEKGDAEDIGLTDRAAKTQNGANPALSSNTQSLQRLVQLQFIGSNPAPDMEQAAPLPGKVSYVLGNDPSRWRTDI